MTTELFGEFDFLHPMEAFFNKKVESVEEEKKEEVKKSNQATSDKVEDKVSQKPNLTLITQEDRPTEIHKISDEERLELQFYQEVVEDAWGNEHIVPKGARFDWEGKEQVLKLPYTVDTKYGPKVHRGFLVEHLIATIPAIFSGGQFFIYEKGVYKPRPTDFGEGIVKYFLTPQHASSATMTDVLNMWTKDLRVFISTEQINENKYIINFRNGILDLKTWEFDPNGHSPQIYSTIQLDAEYDEDAKCPTFDSFLDQAQPDKITQSVLQEMIGYSYTPLTVSKKMLFMFFGVGDTGKSTFLNATLENIIPSSAKSNVALQDLNDPYQKAQVFGKIANINGDLPAKKLDEIDFLKKATGNDPVDARHIYGRPFTYRNTAKFIFSMNTKPANFTGDSSDAFYVRMLLFTWNNKPKKKDQTLAAKLEAEKNGIVQWALRGLKRLVQNEFHFTESAEITKNVDEYRVDSNPVLRFIHDYCEVGEEYEVARTKVFTHFENYCEAEKLSGMSQIRFNQMLQSSYPEIQKGQLKDTRVATWKGIRLKDFIEI